MFCIMLAVVGYINLKIDGLLLLCCVLAYANGTAVGSVC